MDNDRSAIAQMIRDIINGKMNQAQAQNKIQELETQYGTEFFPNYAVEIKDKPWNQEYLNDLELKSMAGMSSKMFILHLAEVSEYVHAQNKKRNTSKKVFGIVAIAAAVLVIAGVIIGISKNKEKPENSASVSDTESGAMTCKNIHADYVNREGKGEYNGNTC